MKKIVYIIFCITYIAFAACHSGHQTPSNPNNTENQEDPNKPNEGENDKPNESEKDRPTDFDIARRLYAQWNSSPIKYDLIDLNLDPLFINGMDASFRTESLAKYVSFHATDVSGANTYKLTDRDLSQLKLSNFKYENGVISFIAKFGTQNYEKKLELNFSREEYLLAKIKPKKKLNLYMQGVSEFPSLFMGELFEYDTKRYDLIPKSSSRIGNSLSMTISVEAHNSDIVMATLVFELDGFKSLDELSKELSIAPSSGFAEKFNRLYRGSKGNIDDLNRHAEILSQNLQFSVKSRGEEVELVWGYTNKPNKQRVLEPSSSQKRSKDLYLIDPKFMIEEVKGLGDILEIKVRLANANETEIKNAIFTITITTPKP